MPSSSQTFNLSIIIPANHINSHQPQPKTVSMVNIIATKDGHCEHVSISIQLKARESPRLKLGVSQLHCTKEMFVLEPNRVIEPKDSYLEA